jgi:hypothetical protein
VQVGRGGVLVCWCVGVGRFLCCVDLHAFPPSFLPSPSFFSFFEKRGYTFNPSQGVCYLKTVNAPTGGFECAADCWYWGKFAGHKQEMQMSLQVQ